MGISSALGSSALLPAGLGFRNVLINGGFDVWQRGTTAVTADGYTADRWRLNVDSPATASVTQQSVITAGIPTARGFAMQVVTTTSNNSAEVVLMEQRIEDVATLNGQQVVLSFWAKANSGTPKIGADLEQNFGSGGSTTVSVTGQSVTISTSWARYSLVYTIPSISGKTVGSSSYLSLFLWFNAGSSYATRSGSIGNQANTFQIWGVQLEANYQPTPFEQRPIGVELQLCQRYYQRFTGAAAYSRFGMGVAEVSNISYALIPFYVEPRTTDTTLWTLSYSTIGTTGNRLILSDGQVITNLTSLSVGATSSSRNLAVYCTTAGGLTIYRLYYLEETSTGNEFVAVSMEL